MQITLRRLDNWLKQNRAAYSAKLLLGASDDDIHGLQQLLNLTLPESFKDFYRWRNGQLATCFEAFHTNKMLLSLKEVGETWEMLTDFLEGGEFEVENWWRKSWIPFMHDGAGNYLCLDLEGTFTGKKGQILEFWHDDFDRDINFPDFESHLKTVVECFEQEKWEADEQFWTVEKDFISTYNVGYPKEVRLS